MEVYFTSDTHFSHPNIIGYCDRPFHKEGDYFIDKEHHRIIWKSDEVKEKDGNWMDEELIKRWNETVNPEDIVYHIGDFGFLNSEEYNNYLNKLNGHIVMICGNHDTKNKAKSYITKCMMNFANKTVYVRHRPPSNIYEIPKECDFVVCGHVHNSYKFKRIGDYIIINVGVDVNDYRPISTKTLLKQYHMYKNGILDDMGNRI